MPWTFVQSSGELLRDGDLVGVGYSGHGEGKNDPAMQSIPNVGPLPCGQYRIGIPYNSESHGPYVLSLTASPENRMFGRAGFLIHGDSILRPGEASHGCIILLRSVREAIHLSGDTALEVVATGDAA